MEEEIEEGMMGIMEMQGGNDGVYIYVYIHLGRKRRICACVPQPRLCISKLRRDVTGALYSVSMLCDNSLALGCELGCYKTVKELYRT